MRILVFGDSIGEGYWDMKSGGWVELLKMNLWKKNPDLQVANLSILGDTSSDLVDRFETNKDSFIKKYQNETILIFAIGINDARLESNKEQTVAQENFIENIEKLIQQSKADNLIKKIIFLSAPNVDQKRSNPVSWRDIYYQNEKIKEYNSYIKDLCQKENCNFIDIFGLLEDPDLFDGIHPNTIGHEKIFKTVEKYLLTHIL